MAASGVAALADGRDGVRHLDRAHIGGIIGGFIWFAHAAVMSMPFRRGRLRGR